MLALSEAEDCPQQVTAPDILLPGAQHLGRRFPVIRFHPHGYFRCAADRGSRLARRANAFFVAAEFALVSVRETRMQQLHRRPPHRCPHRPEAPSEARRVHRRRAVRRHSLQPGPGLDRRSGHGPPLGAALRRLPYSHVLRPRHQHHHSLPADHLHARDPGRDRAQVRRPAAHRGRRPRRRRPHGRLHDPGGAFAGRDDHVLTSGAQGLWCAARSARAASTPPRS